MQDLKHNVAWPTRADYDWAIQNRQNTCHDSDIQTGILLEKAKRPIHFNGGGSKYVCVYRVGAWIVRCFVSQPPQIHPPSDIEERYQKIIPYLEPLQQEMPFLVPHIWVEKGLNVNGKDYSFLKLPFIVGSKQLGDFLYEHYTEPNFCQLANILCNQWLYIIQELEKHQIAHGDLDVSNILVVGTPPNISLFLIDFDGMYVPTLASLHLKPADNGHEHFQPTQSTIRTFGSTMDRFSALIIYLSLCALSKNPMLWERCEANDARLLLGAEDFKRLGLSKSYALLLQESGNDVLQKCLYELQASIMSNRMPHSLSEILSQQWSTFTHTVIETEALQSPSTYQGRAVVIPLQQSTPETNEQPPSPTASTKETTLGNSSHIPKDAAKHRAIIIVIVLAILLGLLILGYYLLTQQAHTPSSFLHPPYLMHLSL